MSVADVVADVLVAVQLWRAWLVYGCFLNIPVGAHRQMAGLVERCLIGGPLRHFCGH
jgi:hypothetical protein